MFINISILIHFFNLSYTWLENNMISNIINFSKIFGNMIILISVILFLILITYIAIKHLKNLPKFYSIKIIDIYGNSVDIAGIRTNFSNYDVAKNYSIFYNNLYKKQYKFYVTGSKDRKTLGFLDISSFYKNFKKNQITYNGNNSEKN